jgi:hypothetical protein
MLRLVVLLLAQVALPPKSIPHEGLYPPPMIRLRDKPIELSGGERRCVYLYTMWDNISNWERIKFCTVPYKVPVDTFYQSPFPELECEGKGCNP